jgi:hypothetical protein
MLREMRATGMMVLVVSTACGDSATPTDGSTCAGQLVTGMATRYGASAGTLADASVCLADGTACTTSKSDGSFTVCVPAHADFILEATKPGFETVLFPWGADVSGVAVEIGDEPTVGSLWTTAGASYPPAPAHIFVTVVSGATRLDFATIAISPSGGVGPVYGDAGEIPTATLTSTSASGTAYFGNVPVGTYDVTVTSVSKPTCVHARRGFASPQANSVRVPTITGATTLVVVSCT